MRVEESRVSLAAPMPPHHQLLDANTPPMTARGEHENCSAQRSWLEWWQQGGVYYFILSTMAAIGLSVLMDQSQLWVWWYHHQCLIFIRVVICAVLNNTNNHRFLCHQENAVIGCSDLSGAAAIFPRWRWPSIPAWPWRNCTSDVGKGLTLTVFTVPNLLPLLSHPGCQTLQWDSHTLSHLAKQAYFSYLNSTNNPKLLFNTLNSLLKP